jgi:hypothetical protein
MQIDYINVLNPFHDFQQEYLKRIPISKGNYIHHRHVNSPSPTFPAIWPNTAADFPFKKIFQGDFKEIASVFDLRKISLFICPGSDWTERTNPSLI